VGCVCGSVAEAHIDVEEGGRMTGVPTRYHGELTATVDGPFGAVGCWGETTTWVLPLRLAIKSVASPAGECNLEMC